MNSAKGILGSISSHGRHFHRRPALWVFPCVVALVLLSWGSLSGPTHSVTGSSHLYPNLMALPPDEFRLENGGTKLRFSVTTWNGGPGVFELWAGQTGQGPDGKHQDIIQRVYSNGGSYSDTNAGTFVWHDNHGHFHVNDYARYTLKEVDSAGQSEWIGVKTTFCIIDTDRINHKLPGAPKKRVYSSCGKEFQGMSVGWGDTYRYYLAGQEIDITGSGDGDYYLTIEVDPKKQFLEENEDDNTNTVRLRITGNTVEVVPEDGDSGHPGKGRCPQC